MSDLVFNVAKGRIVTYGSLPAASDSIIVVPLMSAGLADDATMRAYTSLSTLLAGSSDEQTLMGRQTCTNVTTSLVDSQQNVSCDDVTWTNATGNQIGALVFCYKPDAASGDTDIIPLSKYDFIITPIGNNITAKIPLGGFLRAV